MISLINSQSLGKSKDELPLQVFPLLKEMGTGWGNMKTPPLIERNAKGTRSLVVDVGLDNGGEFFQAIQNGFELVGLEPNPKGFPFLAGKCKKLNEDPTNDIRCEVIDTVKLQEMRKNQQLPLQRKPGTSYLIHAAAGKDWQELNFHVDGAVSSFSAPTKSDKKEEWHTVQVAPLQDIIQEDIYLLKIDTQGFDHYVMEGGQRIFEQYTVRELIFEIEPMGMHNNHISILDTMRMVQKHGMVCFTARSDQYDGCDFHSDSLVDFEKEFFKWDNVKPRDNGLIWSHCWEDFVCVNTHKLYTGPLPTALKS